ncbi:hypothetical protein Bca52824_018031 [Brassica carinata]|uniref:Uncharacterized protein n=1 Tax=Brassica carinata TaxID=52824 RepID=A0A8X7VNQ7_BRACI|nr:hypothetical protein Bca52824_018031 [Brassica carinata]
MTDARMAHHSYENHNNRWTQGGKAKKTSTAHSRQSTRYVPYDRKYEKSWRIKERTEKRVDVQERSGKSYAHSSRAMNNIEASRYSSVSGDHQSQKSSGKGIASKIVSPLCQAPDDNVTKRHKFSPCLLTYSPMEEVVTEDAHVIAALEDMEIIGTSKRNECERDTTLEVMDQDDDLLGEELLDMEKGGMKVSGGEVGVAHMDVERSKPTSVHKSKKRHRLPLGLPIKKAEFLRRGSPILHRSSSRDTYRSESNCLGVGKSSRGNTMHAHNLYYLISYACESGDRIVELSNNIACLPDEAVKYHSTSREGCLRLITARMIMRREETLSCPSHSQAEERRRRRKSPGVV